MLARILVFFVNICLVRVVEMLRCRRWLDSAVVRVGIESSRQRGCKVGVSVAAGTTGRIILLSTASIKSPKNAQVAPLQQHNAFMKNPAPLPRQQVLAKSREERCNRQLLLKQPVLHDVLLLHMLLPHVSDKNLPNGFFVDLSCP